MASAAPSDWLVWLGRMHILTVHFPIALLLAGGALDLFDRGRRQSRERLARAMIGLGALAAVATAALGWVHAWAEPLGSSAHEALTWHRWLGTAAAVLASLAALLGSAPAVRRVVLVLAMLTVAFGAHIGGELVHGEGYFLGDFFARTPAPEPAPQPRPSAGQVDFTAEIAPILQERCVQCHGERKQKAKLRFDRVEPRWFEPGELGAVIVRGKPEESELVRRLQLPPDDEDHMPPAEEPQPTPEEIELLRRWIAEGAATP
jgi:uncharacterized membrane protein